MLKPLKTYPKKTSLELQKLLSSPSRRVGEFQDLYLIVPSIHLATYLEALKPLLGLSYVIGKLTSIKLIILCYH